MEEEEALRSYCSRMIRVLKNHHPGTSKQGERREKHTKWDRDGASRTRSNERKDMRKIGTGRPVGVGDWSSDHKDYNLHLSEPPKQQTCTRKRDLTSHNLVYQGPAADQLVPPHLISLLKHKTLKEEMRLALQVELHDPSVCNVCEQERASLALNTFIRRKKTQLDAQTLEDRLNTHLCNRDNVCLLGELVQSLPKASDAPHLIWEGLLGRDTRVTATWGCLGNKSGMWSCPDNR